MGVADGRGRKTIVALHQIRGGGLCNGWPGMWAAVADPIVISHRRQVEVGVVDGTTLRRLRMDGRCYGGSGTQSNVADISIEISFSPYRKQIWKGRGICMTTATTLAIAPQQSHILFVILILVGFILLSLPILTEEVPISIPISRRDTDIGQQRPWAMETEVQRRILLLLRRALSIPFQRSQVWQGPSS